MAKAAKKHLAADPVMGKIRTVQRTARLWTLYRAYLVVFLIACAMLFAGIVLDHVLVLQKGTRVGFLAVFCTVGLVAAAAATLLPLFRRLGDLYVAREIERTAPDLRNSLITYVQCRADLRVRPEVKRLLLHNVAERVNEADPQLAANPRRTFRLAWALLGLMALFGLYAGLSPKSALVSVRRLFFPRAAILPPTATRITEVWPGDVWLLQGSEPQIRVRTEGTKPDKAYLAWSGSGFAERKVWLSSKDGTQWEGRFPPVLADGLYHVVAGDTKSEKYTMKVLEKPAVLELQATLIPPAYTGLPQRTVQGGNFEAVWGSTARIRCHTSVPPRLAYIKFGSGRRVWMKLDADQNLIYGEFQVTDSDSYRIFFKTPDYPDGSSFQNTSPVGYEVKCLKDRAPVVRVQEPPDGAQMESDGAANLECTARDDFCVRQLALHYRLDGIEYDPIRLDTGEGGPTAKARYTWDFSGLPLRKGSVIEYRVAASDNWPQGPNIGFSEMRRIRFGPPEAAHPPQLAAPVQDTASETTARAHVQVARTEQHEPPPAISAAERKALPPRETMTTEKIREIVKALRRSVPTEAPAERRVPEPLQQAKQRPAKPGEPREFHVGQNVPADQQNRTPADARRGRDQQAAAPQGSDSPREAGRNAAASLKHKGAQAPGAPPRQKPSPAEAPATASAQGPGGECACESGATSAGAPGTRRQQGGAESAEIGSQPRAASQGTPAPGERHEERAAARQSQRGAARAGTPQQATAASGGAASRRDSGRQSAVRNTGAGNAAGAGVLEPDRIGVGTPGELTSERLDEDIAQIERLLNEGRLSGELLKDIGTNRRQLENLIKRYGEQRKRTPVAPAQQTQQEVQNLPLGLRGAVIEPSATASDEVRVDAARPVKPPKDDLRSLFEGTGKRISSRYRDLVDAYYERLSEQK